MDRYEEALAKARAEYEKAREQGYTWLMNLLEGMFPDLKESEDERHWKWILEYLYDGLQKADEQFKDQFKSAIAYLEKQKAKERLDRMAPIYNDKESFEFALEKAWKYYNESASKTVDSFEDDYIECVFSKGFREGFLYREKQKESLHITEMCKENAGSFTDEDEDRTINGCLLAANAERRCKRASEELLEELGLADYTKFFYEQGVEKGKKEREKQKEQKNFQTKVQQRMEYLWDKLPDSHKVENGDCTPEEWKTLGAYMELEMNFDEDGFVKQKEQKPAEWSEKDEKMLDLIIEIFTVNHANGVFGTGNRVINGFNFVSTYTIIDWLKSIRPQPKQDWSEEEQQIIDNAACTIISFSNTVETKEEEEELCELASKLQDLKPKPHWKPSEEQMNALYDILHPADPVNRDAVKSLYNDLQKLL